MTPRELEQLYDQVIGYVREHGHVAMQIEDPDGYEPDFTYSIGFPVSVDHPEVIVFGLPTELREHMIHALYAMMSQEGLKLADGMRVGGLLGGFDCVAREVIDPDAIAEHFCTAIGYHESQHGKTIDRAFQIVWPSAENGLFPWDDGCAEGVIDNQPALYPTSLNS